jgi:propanediol utilization protein
MADFLKIPVSTSMRHAHLSQTHVEMLFGPEHKLTPKADLSQPGQFAAEEVVAVCGPKGALKNVRVLGPARSSTQVEISRTDEFALGIDAPIRPSGEIKGTPGLRLEGPKGTVELAEGVIQAQRHIHMSPADADRFGVKDKEWVMGRRRARHHLRRCPRSGPPRLSPRHAPRRGRGQRR